MNNEKAYEITSDNSDVKISNLVWVACTSYQPLKDMCDQIPGSDFIKMFPEIAEDDDFEHYSLTAWDMRDLFITHKKLGFIAEIHIPVLRNVVLTEDKKQILGYSGTEGNCRIYYAYSETLEGLVSEMESLWKSHIDYYLQIELKSGKYDEISS